MSCSAHPVSARPRSSAGCVRLERPLRRPASTGRLATRSGSSKQPVAIASVVRLTYGLGAHRGRRHRRGTKRTPPAHSSTPMAWCCRTGTESRPPPSRVPTHTCRSPPDCPNHEDGAAYCPPPTPQWRQNPSVRRCTPPCETVFKDSPTANENPKIGLCLVSGGMELPGLTGESRHRTGTPGVGAPGSPSAARARLNPQVIADHPDAYVQIGVVSLVRRFGRFELPQGPRRVGGVPVGVCHQETGARRGVGPCRSE